MPVNRFWSSVWSVVAYLFGIAILQYIVMQLVTLFTLIPLNTVTNALVYVVTPIAGTLVYVNWRWGWHPENLGLNWRPASFATAFLGIGIGAVAAYLMQLVSSLLKGQLVLGVGMASLEPLNLILALLAAFTVELTFRGAVISRYLTDPLTRMEVLLASVLTPFAWNLIGGLLGFARFLDAGLSPDQRWLGVLSVFLALLFLRTESLWLSIGIRAGLVLTLGVLDLQVSDQGAVVLWLVAIVVLLILEWMQWQQEPHRVQGPRATYRKTFRGRVVKGPWGPH